MQAPRCLATATKAGETTTQAAKVSANCDWYLGWLKKPNSLGAALAKGARRVIHVWGSPCNSPPKASMI